MPAYTTVSAVLTFLLKEDSEGQTAHFCNNYLTTLTRLGA